MKTVTYTRTGTLAPETTLDKAVFDVTVQEDLLKQAVTRTLANKRHAGAKTLTRGEVRGGGRKPWRQKGTGRARFGSTRVNIWRHGGVAHGPTGMQNYHKDMPKNMIAASLRMALSTQRENTVVIQELKLKEPKTQVANQFLAKIKAEGNILIVLEKSNEEILRAFRNLPAVSIVTYNQLLTYDVLIADTIVLDSAVLKPLSDWLGKGKSK